MISYSQQEILNNAYFNSLKEIQNLGSQKGRDQITKTSSFTGIKLTIVTGLEHLNLKIKFNIINNKISPVHKDRQNHILE